MQSHLNGITWASYYAQQWPFWRSLYHRMHIYMLKLSFMPSNCCTSSKVSCTSHDCCWCRHSKFFWTKDYGWSYGLLSFFQILVASQSESGFGSWECSWLTREFVFLLLCSNSLQGFLASSSRIVPALELQCWGVCLSCGWVPLDLKLSVVLVWMLVQ